MDTAAFATWLGGIGLLDPAQRAEAFRELALAEADDPITLRLTLPMRPCCLVRLLLRPRSRSRRRTMPREEDLLSKVGRGRIARFGCPPAVGTTFAPGARLAASLGSAHQLPEDIQPADRDAVGRLASPGSLA